MIERNSVHPILVLGVGNLLLTDESAGVRVIGFLEERMPESSGVILMDGGTIGLGLLNAMEDAASLIIVDAARMGEAPGTVRVFLGEEMDAFLRTRGRSPHDIGLDDLLDALRLRECVPERRALIGIEPRDLAPGDGLSEAVAASVPVAADHALAIIGEWSQISPRGAASR